MSLLHGEHFPHLPVRMRKVAAKSVVKHWNRLPTEVGESLRVDVHLGRGFSGGIRHCWFDNWI